MTQNTVRSEIDRFCDLLDKAAAHDHRRTAENLDILRDRIGRNNLSVDEWNALITASQHLRVEAWRREKRSDRPAAD